MIELEENIRLLNEYLNELVEIKETLKIDSLKN